MDFAHWSLAALIGAGISETLVVIFSLPDPPPPTRALITLVIGAVFGIAGGWLGSAVSNDPMPALWGSAAGGLLAAGLVGAFGGAGRVAR